MNKLKQSKLRGISVLSEEELKELKLKAPGDCTPFPTTCEPVLCYTDDPITGPFTEGRCEWRQLGPPWGNTCFCIPLSDGSNDGGSDDGGSDDDGSEDDGSCDDGSCDDGSGDK